MEKKESDEAIDIAVLFLMTENGNTMMVIMDNFMKWMTVYTITNQKAAIIKEFIS